MVNGDLGRPHHQERAASVAFEHAKHLEFVAAGQPDLDHGAGSWHGGRSGSESPSCHGASLGCAGYGGLGTGQLLVDRSAVGRSWRCCFARGGVLCSECSNHANAALSVRRDRGDSGRDEREGRQQGSVAVGVARQ